MIEVFLDEGAAAAHLLESAIDRQQNDEIGGGDEEQKNRRDQRADGAADELEAVEAALERAGGQRDDGGGEHHHGRMAEREEEADADRPLALLHQLARHVVDRRDMVGIDGVAQTERIGQERGADQHRIIAKRDQRPDPRQNIGGDQQAVNADKLVAEFRVPVIKEFE